MADLSNILVRDIRFREEDRRLQWQLQQWRSDLTLATLDEMSIDALYRIPGLGKKSVNAIVEACARWKNV